MDRRKLLKTISLSLGCTLVAPSVFQILLSCEVKKDNHWIPEYLNRSQATIVAHLADIIIPSTKTYGAKDVNIPQFIDLVLKDLVSDEEKKFILKGINLFYSKFKDLFRKDVINGTKNEFTELLSLYFDIPSEKKELIFESLKRPEAESLYLDQFYIYKFLIFIRNYTLIGFYTSTKVGKELLNYDPIPGSYIACV